MSKFILPKHRWVFLAVCLLFRDVDGWSRAEASNRPVTQKQLTAEATFLNQTKAFNQQLLVVVAVMRQVRTRREFEDFDKREQREQKLKLNEWFQARDACFRAGVKDDAKVWPELNRELTLTYQLLDELTRVVHSFLPEINAPGADPF